MDERERLDELQCRRCRQGFVDRATRELVGAAMACPDASAAIHECVVAIRAHVPVDLLAETIHAFPSTSRIFNGLFADARRELDHPSAPSAVEG